MSAEELSLRGIDYDYVDLEEIGKSAAEVTGRKVKTVPQIYLEGKYIGGYEDLMMHLKGEVEYEPIEGDDECRACEG
jgi:glutaredoxin